MDSAIDVDAKPPVSGVVHADPTLIAEANLREESTLANIREYRHKDSYGNAIGEFIPISPTTRECTDFHPSRP